MDLEKYDVMLDNDVIATALDMEIALILIEALTNKYDGAMRYGLTIGLRRSPVEYNASDIDDECKKEY